MKLQKHKYLEDIGIKRSEIPENYCIPDKEREPKWSKQRKKYGFDDRDTRNLDYTIKCFLYERLMMLREIGAECVDYTYHKFEYNDKEYNGLKLIDMLIEALKLDLSLDEYDKQRETTEVKEKIDSTFDILKLIMPMLWW